MKDVLPVGLWRCAALLLVSCVRCRVLARGAAPQQGVVCWIWVNGLSGSTKLGWAWRTVRAGLATTTAPFSACPPVDALKLG